MGQLAVPTLPWIAESWQSPEGVPVIDDLHDPHTIVCNHCLGPIDWPCPTAKLIYREDAL